MDAILSTVFVFLVGLAIGTWVSRRKAVARAFAAGGEAAAAAFAQSTATGGSVVINSADIGLHPSQTASAALSVARSENEALPFGRMPVLDPAGRPIPSIMLAAAAWDLLEREGVNGPVGGGALGITPGCDAGSNPDGFAAADHSRHDASDDSSGGVLDGRDLGRRWRDAADASDHHGSVGNVDRSHPVFGQIRTLRSHDDDR